jgi:hypothetical protein
MRTKPAGFSRDDLRRVVAVMLLHSSRPGGDSLLPIPPGLLRDKTVRQLGVLLRVADGLDHSHLQDTCITRVALSARRDAGEPDHGSQFATMRTRRGARRTSGTR